MNRSYARPKCIMKVRIMAWGSAVYPDLDYKADDPPELDLIRRSYPCISLHILTPILHSVIMAGLNEPKPCET